MEHGVRERRGDKILIVRKNMDKAEQVAETYLKQVFGSDVIFEPDGNITPDFLANGSVAIEVRRLNQNHFGGDAVKGLEQEQIPLYYSFSKVCSEFDTRTDEDCYWVMLKYHRPIDKMKPLKKALKEALKDFLLAPSTPKTIPIGTNFEIQILKGGSQTNQKFRIGGESDHDSGGWIHEIYTENINHAMAEKAGKISSHKSKYPSWWLVLVDNLGPLDEYDKPDVLKHLNKDAAWDQVVVIHPQSGVEIIKI